MIKLTHQLSAKADKITKSGNILAFNGIDYDLSDLSSLPQKIEPTEENPNPDNGPIYTDGIDIFVFFHADQHQFDDLNHGNLMRIHDLNNNRQFEVSEFLGLVDFLGMTEAKRREYKKEKMDEFLISKMSVEFQADKIKKDKIISGLSDAKKKAFDKEFSEAKKAWMDKGK